MKAQEFLQYLAATHEAGLRRGRSQSRRRSRRKRRREIQDAAAAVAPKYAAMLKTPPPKNTLELARAIVRYRNGSWVMREEGSRFL